MKLPNAVLGIFDEMVKFMYQNGEFTASLTQINSVEFYFCKLRVKQRNAHHFQYIEKFFQAISLYARKMRCR